MPYRRRRAVMIVATILMIVPVTATASPLPLGDLVGPITGLGTSPSTASTDDARIKAGAAAVDATWHVGASAGQYASDGVAIHEGAFDPSVHSTRRVPSQGIESRSSVRALVVEGGDGQRVAIVANDLYIPQALLNARVASILIDRDAAIAAGQVEGVPTGIGWENLTVSVSHSHTSPYYSTPSWGVWAFQDVFDVRFFEFYAQRTADAVVQASEALRPARMGAHRVPFAATQRHSFGPTVGDDGTPAGYPHTDNDKVVEVVRFDGAEAPHDPIATWVVFGLHPEMLDGNDLHSGEYVHAMYRIVDRTAGGVTLFTQNNTGTAEPGRDGVAQPPEARAEFTHREYAQMTRAGSLLAEAVLGARDEIATGDPIVPYLSDIPVAVRSEWFAPPGARASPTVSSCRTEQTFDANPGVPVAGLPDCVFPAEEAGLNEVVDELPFDTRVTYDQLRAAGVPVPDNTGAPSVTGLQETVAVHLQAIRLGPVGITVCPCEQWADQSRNIKSRLDRLHDNLWLGFDWTAQTIPADRPDDRAGDPWCADGGDGTWTCGDPRSQGYTDLTPVGDLAYRRMVAQVRNDAAGWDDLANALAAEADPVDPAAIWGNYTHEELTDDPSFGGYRMVITAGMANDYWGYIATYREFQRGDHYRKALTGLGPHSSDFLATRLSRLAAGLAGYDGGTKRTEKDDLYATVEPPRLLAVARAIGAAAQAYVPLYAATLPADGGEARILAQPAASIERFHAASVTWLGGSNWFDVPEVVVERRASDGTWSPFEDTTGGVQVQIRYPELPEAGAWRTGSFEWRWTATFEAFASDLALPDLSGQSWFATPPGEYRFVVSGTRHLGAGATEPYALTSEPFTVVPWTGIAVPGVAVSDGDVVVSLGPVSQVDFGDVGTRVVGPIDYPDTYASPFAVINGQRELKEYRTHPTGPVDHEEQFCFHCSFEPWLDVGDAAEVVVTVVRSGGATEEVAAVRQGDGTWMADTDLLAGDRAFVGAGGVTDAFSNTNRAPSEETSAQ